MNSRQPGVDENNVNISIPIVNELPASNSDAILTRRSSNGPKDKDASFSPQYKVSKTAEMMDASPAVPDIETQSRRTRTSSRSSMPTSGIYDNFKVKLTQIYAARVSYKTETFLYFLLLIPYVVIVGAMVVTPNMVFPNTDSAAWYKTIAILIGLFATHATELINERHVLLSSMAKIKDNEATVKTVCDGFSSKGKNRLLIWMRNLELTSSFFLCLSPC